jgi:hypothetical protein
VRRVHAKVSLATGGAAAGTAIGIKLGIVALVVTVAAGAGLYARRGATPAVPPDIELTSPSEVPLQMAVHEPPAPAISDDDLITIETPQLATPRHASQANEVTRAAQSASPAVSASSSSPAPPASSFGEAASPPSAGRPAPPLPPSRIDLAREVELLDVAMAALRGGDAAGALKAVQRHADETAGRGQLAEDAAAIEIEALCHLHDPTTNAKLEAFDARFPRSAQRSRLSNRCP